MSVIGVTTLNSYCDEMVSSYLRARGTLASTYGIGIPGDSYGVVDEVADILAAWKADTNTDSIAAVAAAMKALESAASAKTYARSLFSNLLLALGNHVSAYGLANVRKLDDFLTYKNTAEGTKWQTLQHPYWRDLHADSDLPAVNNVYFEVLEAGTFESTTFTNALRKAVVTGAGTDNETAGYDIDQTKYCGGFPKIKVSGLTGTGVCTVTGTAYDPSTKNFLPSKTWTYSLTTNGTFALAPGGASAAPTDSLIAACSAVAVEAGISAGTIYVEAHRPTGRPTLP